MRTDAMDNYEQQSTTTCKYLLGAIFTVLADDNPLAYLDFAKLGAVEQRSISDPCVLLSNCYGQGDTMMLMMFYPDWQAEQHNMSESCNFVAHMTTLPMT